MNTGKQHQKRTTASKQALCASVFCLLRMLVNFPFHCPPLLLTLTTTLTLLSINSLLLYFGLLGIHGFRCDVGCQVMRSDHRCLSIIYYNVHKGELQHTAKEEGSLKRRRLVFSFKLNNKHMKSNRDSKSNDLVQPTPLLITWAAGAHPKVKVFTMLNMGMELI